MPRNYVRKTNRKLKRTKMPTHEKVIGDRVLDEEGCLVNEGFAHIKEPIRQKRRVFVREYLKDGDAGAAMLRCGFKDEWREANTLGAMWLREAYVQHLIDLVATQLDEDELVPRRRVLKRLWEEANRFTMAPDNGHGCRIKALQALAKIKGMEVMKVEATVTHHGGVMLIPATMSAEDWEAQAKAQQSHLREIARN